LIAIPAIDLRGGQAVQLVGGVRGSERVRIPDPLSVAAHWAGAGFGALHIIDLDAAFRDGDNRATVNRLVSESGLVCQVGGGVRDDSAIEELIAAGAHRIIIGTRAIEDTAWLLDAALAWPDQLVVAADVRDGHIVTRGWTHDTDIDATAFVTGLDALSLAAILVTDVGREGREQGVDVEMFTGLAKCTRLPLHAAGGISSIEDLRALRDGGIAAAILGMALYTGRLDPITAALEFGS
jgi:phosphoribosylformimino-5-aminoimidazole carboxamide ribotide isomerase